MRMSELSTATATPVPTLKFYLREGLLHAGERTSPNQAQYDESHINRVRLVRALIDVGGLPVARAAEVVSAMQRDDLPVHSVLGIAQRAVTERLAPSSAPEEESPSGIGRRLIDELCARRGWRVHRENPGLAMAARVLDAYVALGQGALLEALEAYADAAELVARADLAAVAAAGERSRGDRTEMVDVVIVGTVLGDALAAGLRRAAQEHASLERFPAPDLDHDRQDTPC